MFIIDQITTLYFIQEKEKIIDIKKINGRNEHFINIINKVDYKVEILYDNLTEQQALDLEKETIYNLVFNEGYGIDIDGYRKPNEIKHLCNATFGGEGTSGYKHTEEWKRNNSGENHPMFGKHHSEESRKKTSEALKGENNPFYGKGYLISGENHYFYGQTMSEEQRNKISETRINNEVAKGKNNPMAKAVICITTMEIFDTAKEGAEYYKDYKASRSGISQCCSGNRKSSGKLEDGTPLVWRLYKDYLEEHNNNNNIA